MEMSSRTLNLFRNVQMMVVVLSDPVIGLLQNFKKYKFLVILKFE